MWIWVAIVALLTLFFFGSSREGLRGWKTQENGTDYYGNDIAGSPTTKDVAACASSCAANTSCNLMVSDVSSGTGNCWLKTNAGTKSNPSNRFARQLSTVADKGSFRCESNPAALGASNTASVFRYNSSNNTANHYPSPEIANFWDPKWDTNDTYVDCTGLTKGMSMTKPSVWTQEMNINHNGADLSSESMTTPDKCLTDCINNPACKGTVFNGSKCWLKSTIGTKVASTGVHSYMKADPPLPSTGWSLFTNTNYAQGDLSSLTGSTIQACTDACKSNSDCKGFVFDTHDDKCYLKKTITNKSTLNGVHSYLKPKDTSQVTTQEGNWTKKTNTAFPNPDGKTVVGTFANLQDSDCKTKCLNTKDCKGFTNYAYDAGGSSCLLMSSSEGDFNYSKEGETANSYKLSVPPPVQLVVTEGKWTIDSGSAYSGNILKTLTGSNTQSCKTECEKTTYCKGIMVDKVEPDTATCSLMSDFSGRYTSQLVDSYAMSNQADDLKGWTSFSNVVNGNKNLGAECGKSLDECKSLCKDNSSCKGFAYGDHWSDPTQKQCCYLKGENDGTFLDSRYTTYDKSAIPPEPEPEPAPTPEPAPAPTPSPTPEPAPAPTPTPTPTPSPEPVKITPEKDQPSPLEPVAFNDNSTFLGFNF